MDTTMDRGPADTTPSLQAPRHWLKVPVILAAIGIFAIIALLWINNHREHEHQDSMRTSALMDINISVTHFHLWFEEFMSGDITVNMEENWSRLDAAESLVAILLAGGKTHHSMISNPLESPELHGEVERLGGMLASFRQAAVERLEKRGSTGIDSALDQRFDVLFEAIIEKSYQLETAFSASEEAHRSHTTAIFRMVIAAMFVCLVFAVVIITRLEVSKKRLVTKLITANNEIKTLSGLLPVCSWCKKIRDDSGKWQKLETYIRTHSEAEFTHGICPECMDRQKGH